MDMMPPPGFWEMPAEVRRVNACTHDEPCVNAPRDDDEHHHEDDEKRPAPRVDAMPPGQRLLDIPHIWWRRQPRGVAARGAGESDDQPQ